MSADSANPSPQPVGADQVSTARRRRIVRLTWAAGFAAVALAVPAAAYGIAGGFSGQASRPVNAAQHPVSYKAGRRHAASVKPAAGRAGPAGYIAYVSAAGGEEVVEVDVATDAILKTFSADSTYGVAATPTNSQVFIAETGQYHVIAANPATGAETPIYVGPYPQDVAVSPDSGQVYATVTGSDTGPGGSDVVAATSPLSTRPRAR